MLSYDNITLDTFQTSWLPAQLSAAMLRLDKIHPEVSGNKWFKLKYNIAAATADHCNGILTFGGAYSNHIAATAVACKEAGLACMGIIRGQEHDGHLNHTLQTAEDNGMGLVFVTREDYRNNITRKTYEALFPDYHVVPEGGHNALGAKGCEDILSIHPTAHYTHILCAVGTGTTLAGLINSAAPHQHITGIAVLKGAAYLEEEVASLLHLPQENRPQWQLLHDHHLGGYAKKTPALIDFINTFYTETGIPTDIIYTGKLVMAFHHLAQQGYFPTGSRILLIHTGGLQGNLSLPPGVLSF
ncbi:1-aminocyclopropane-1-carboxylate deaminase/D-cysteine desulfhydrase [Chitinophaga arvensicola]|uniref:1-aminocyclopropane-1-carboxylate deaminase n=1 Tax=Chitinophaga arvensicola TaxID=29529 RepID=A0A1I0SCD6_9BACT|nr:pyridoxal-phosphate dependent enzyme [Chitinophaga arvensicola]SEW54753.1 1-aminocyclopropane-1-carboxylate deaminase [Chitinophaga arvensicola]